MSTTDRCGATGMGKHQPYQKETLMSDKTQSEAHHILNNMSQMAGYHGTTTADVVDFMCENYSMTVFCNGILRNIVFTKITAKSFAFKTEAAWMQ